MAALTTRIWRSWDEQDDAGSGVGSSDADVVQSAVVADGDRSGLVDAVVADPLMRLGRLGVCGRSRQRLAAGQGELDLGLDIGADDGGPLPITSSRMGHLWDALVRVYEVLGFEAATGGDEEVFQALVLARLQATRADDEARRDPVDHLTERHPATGRGLTGAAAPARRLTSMTRRAANLTGT